MPLTGPLVAGAFRAAAAVRGARALHPRGEVARGDLVRSGLADPTGVDWLDRPGTDGVLVRTSRGAGLPSPWPDVLGLAVRVEEPSGGAAPWDLLLASTLGRRVPWPRRDVRHALLSSIAAFRGPHGRLLLGARWVEGGFVLAVASPRGPWRPFAQLRPGAPAGDVPDVGFDPVLNAVPGLDVPTGWRRLREPAYAGSRRGRGLSPWTV